MHTRTHTRSVYIDNAMFAMFYLYNLCSNVSLQNNVQLLKTLKLDGAFVVDMEEYCHHSAGNVI